MKLQPSLQTPASRHRARGLVARSAAVSLIVLPLVRRSRRWRCRQFRECCDRLPNPATARLRFLGFDHVADILAFVGGRERRKRGSGSGVPTKRARQFTGDPVGRQWIRIPFDGDGHRIAESRPRLRERRLVHAHVEDAAVLHERRAIAGAVDRAADAVSIFQSSRVNNARWDDDETTAVRNGFQLRSKGRHPGPNIEKGS